MKFKIYLLFFTLIFIPGNTQNFPVSPPVKMQDSLISSPANQYYTDSLLIKNPTTNNSIFPKNFKEKFQSKYKGADFDYTTVKPHESFWQKVKRRLGKILESIFGKVDPNKTVTFAENVIRIFAVVIISFMLYFLIKFLLDKSGNFFFTKKNKKIYITNQDLQENIHEINFSSTIENLERQKEFRAAVRYQFLGVLKNLTDKQLINWNPEKTNKDYLMELQNTEAKTNFKELVHIFDFVWYGEFIIT